MVFSPFDRTKQEAKQGVVRTLSRETLFGDVARREILDCFKVNKYGK